MRGEHPLHVGAHGTGIGLGMQADPHVGGGSTFDLDLDVGIGHAGEQEQFITQGVDRHAGLPSCHVPGSVNHILDTTHRSVNGHSR